MLVRVLATTTTHTNCVCARIFERVFGGKKVVAEVVHGSSFIVPGLVTWRDLAPKLTAD